MGAVFTNVGDEGLPDIRLSILLTEKSNPSGRRAVFARLPEEHKREIAAVLLDMVGGAEVARTIMRAEITIYSRGNGRKGGGWCCLRWHRDGDLKLGECGPLCMDVCSMFVCVRVRVCVCVYERVCVAARRA